MSLVLFSSSARNHLLHLLHRGATNVGGGGSAHSLASTAMRCSWLLASVVEDPIINTDGGGTQQDDIIPDTSTAVEVVPGTTYMYNRLTSRRVLRQRCTTFFLNTTPHFERLRDMVLLNPKTD